ncbi:WbqC family protein [Pseudomonas gingeri]|uniref:WbqC family protein n=1 Tax=Pseudomonas gingeri TaxID=117681 RepID=UPI00159F81A3|nr:WbqC family protein [Pseudomonas gingeri]NVZ61192.1 WbqC family protein [Pseudomonas gingeri]NVZ73745.1 WbqC family protein [Pseudomonas gingeri]
MNIVISQSMLFPWVGLLEQVRLADVFVHYDDVQFSKGSFVNRVQIKTPQGMRWMAVPLVDLHLGQKINEVQVPPSEKWRDAHLALLENSLANAPFRRDALELVERVYAADYANVGALARASLMALVEYFGLDTHCRFVDVESLGIPGSSSDRVLSVVKCLDGDKYITGHGASRYLDHELFERSGVAVEYMTYNCTPYPQAHGEFTPYVSALDLVANCGKQGLESINSGTTDWRSFKNEPA